MMPKTDLFAPAPAAPDVGGEMLSPEYSPIAQSGAGDFFAMVSQAVTKSPEPPPPRPVPDFSSYNTLQSETAAYSDDDGMGSPASSISENRNRQTSTDSTDDANSSDPSVLSTIMALFAQPPAPPENSKPVPAAGKDKDIKVDAGMTGAETTNEKAGSLAAQKLSGISADGKVELAGKGGKSVAPNAPKSPAETAKLQAAEVALKDVAKAATDMTKPPASASDLAAKQDIPLAAQERLAPPVPPDGTGAALNRQRMKFASEKNEIAGRAVQKLPDASDGDNFSGSSDAKIDIKTDPELARGGKDSFDSNLAMNFSAKDIATEFALDKSVGKAESLDPASQVDRINQLVSQEIVTIRQSGANSLAVSLKVDQHTEIFLQLHNNDGQIQASIHFERGNIESLSNHWGQLQESLARQNVHLLPMEDRTASRNPSFTQPAPSTQSRAFDQSFHNGQQQTRESREDALPVNTREPQSVRKTQTNKRSLRGWESWA